MISSHQFASKFRYSEDRPSDKVSSNEANQKLEILEVHKAYNYQKYISINL